MRRRESGAACEAGPARGTRRGGGPCGAGGQARWAPSGAQAQAGATGLEPATSAVTGQRSNLLSYAPAERGIRDGGLRAHQVCQGSARGPGTSILAIRPASALGLGAWRSSAPRRCSTGARSRCCSTTCATSARRRFRSRRARRASRCRARAASPRNRSRCCSSATSATARSSRCGCSTATSCSCSGRRRTTTSLVSHASNFEWREGHFRDLIGLMGDGLLTIDGDFHRRSRRIMLPAFHREHIAASVDGDPAGDRSGARAAAAGRDGGPLRVDAPPRDARRDAGAVRPRPRRRRGARDRRGRRCSRRRSPSTRASTCCASSAGGASPWARMQAAARKLDALIYARDRRAPRERAGAAATSSACCSTPRTRTATALNDVQIRDEVMTLLFAGHDTTTSTVSFMFYELARQPALAGALLAEQARAAAPTAGRAPHSCSAASCPSSRW